MEGEVQIRITPVDTTEATYDGWLNPEGYVDVNVSLGFGVTVLRVRVEDTEEEISFATSVGATIALIQMAERRRKPEEPADCDETGVVEGLGDAA